MDEESYLLRVNTLETGTLKLTDLPFISNSLDNKHILFGNGFLSKFKVTLDYPAQEMILKPYNKSFETNILSYGLHLSKKDQTTLVTGIWDNSSAARSGIKIGDEIVAINSKSVSALSNFDLMTLLLDRSSKEMEIAFINDKQEHSVTLHKEMVLPELSNERKSLQN